MNKEQFLQTLKNHLQDISEAERNELLYDYSEHFNMGKEAGRTEEEIAASLGNPRLIAKEIKANYMISKAETTTSTSNVLNALIATIGLGFFNLVFILGPYIGIAATLFALFVSGLAVSFSGIVTIVVSVVTMFYQDFGNLSVHPVVGISAGVGLTALGILWVIGCYYLNKVFYILTLKYLKINLNIIMNRRK